MFEVGQSAKNQLLSNKSYIICAIDLSCCNLKRVCLEKVCLEKVSIYSKTQINMYVDSMCPIYHYHICIHMKYILISSYINMFLYFSNGYNCKAPADTDHVFNNI